jgi:sterol desaturase/sphingolipid hydroxylase (fatty acid hydroxylase superfamily)
MKWLSGAITIGTFAILYVFEKRRPLRRQVEPKETNTTRNLAIATAAGAAILLFEKPLTDKLTALVEKRRVGLLKIFRLPKFLETVLAVVLLDYTLYLWHVLTHKLPFLWRFHQIHHADLDLNASTAIRFHFGEMTISVLFRAGQILVLGITPKNLQIWQTFLFLNVFFHHSNIRLPKSFEKKLQNLITTPRLHGIHHSTRENERNSNWSSGFTAWDFLHKTFRDDVPQDKIVIGVEEFEKPEDVTLGKMLAEPFKETEHRFNRKIELV